VSSDEEDRRRRRRARGGTSDDTLVQNNITIANTIAGMSEERRTGPHNRDVANPVG
jgi:hypothetical protein